MTQSIITQLQNETLGRQMLALCGVTPLRCEVARITFASNAEQIAVLPPGALLTGITVYLAESFDGGDTNELIVSAVTVAESPVNVIVGTVADLAAIAGSAVPIDDFKACYSATAQTAVTVGLTFQAAHVPDAGEALIALSYVLVDGV